jgi:hypothetical protein
MKKARLLLILGIIQLTGFGQINMADSTAQSIGYWDLNEKQLYTITSEKTRTKGLDTTSHELISYEVEITIKDSTATSYTIEWYYKNFTVDSKNEILNKIMKLSENFRLLIRTNELGVFQEVINWKEYKDYMGDIIGRLKKEYKDAPTMIKLLEQTKEMYSTKEVIEAAGINEIQQYYSFHGLKYKLGETYESNTTVPNIYGNEPFDSNFKYYLDEINETDNNYILRSSQTINAEQLTNASYEYVVKTMKTMGMPAPKRDEFKEVTNETNTASRIHGTGWVIYSIQTKTVTSEDNTHIDELIIEIQ